jgi:hypothetical protein
VPFPSELTYRTSFTFIKMIWDVFLKWVTPVSFKTFLQNIEGYYGEFLYIGIGLFTRGVLLNFYFAATNNTNGSNN